MRPSVSHFTQARRCSALRVEMSGADLLKQESARFARLISTTESDSDDDLWACEDDSTQHNARQRSTRDRYDRSACPVPPAPYSMRPKSPPLYALPAELPAGSRAVATAVLDVLQQGLVRLLLAPS